MSAPFDPHRRGPQHPTYDGANYPNPPNQPQQFIPQQPQQFGGYSSPPFQGGNVGGKFGQPHGYPGGPQGFAAGGDGGAFFGPSLPSAQLGLHLGTQALSVGQDYVNKNISKFVPKQQLKSYFNVTNSYVFQKILLILFPFRHKSWQRGLAQPSVDGHGHEETYSPPRDDINAPDLYIPAMAFVTYIILVGLNTGLHSKFHPEILGKTASKAGILVFLEWGAIKLGLYLFSLGADMNALDILSVIGYNYVGLIVTVTVDMMFGTYGKWATFVYVGIAMFFFVLRSLRQNFLPESTEALVISQRRKPNEIERTGPCPMLQTMKRPMGLGETAAYTTRNPKRLRLLVEPSLLGRKRESADNLESAIEYQILPTKHPRLWSEDKTPPAFVGANKAEASKVEELSRKSFEFSGTLKDFLGRDEKFLINATNKPDSKSRQLVLYQPPPNSSLGDGELEATETDNTNMMDVS